MLYELKDNPGFLTVGCRSVEYIVSCKIIILGLEDSFIVFKKPSPMAVVPEEGNSNTACCLFPPFQG
jgi:hypothetical protein